MRQESAFSTDAQSSVGARGLMQLMPGTAAQIANKLQLPFSLPRLSSDGLYNMMLGRSYIESMIDDFGGSYPLAIAAYNAGPGRVRQWVRDFGDPRGHDLTMVDWIEMIPFTETRDLCKAGARKPAGLSRPDRRQPRRLLARRRPRPLTGASF